MKILCPHCNKKVNIIVSPAGPHLKASCTKCRKYIKFLNSNEKRQLEKDEDEKK